MAQHYSATFADGSVETRSSTSRTYSHAWKVVASYTTQGEPRTFTGKGFSGSRELADAACGSYVASVIRGGGRIHFQGVVGVEQHAKRAR